MCWCEPMRFLLFQSPPRELLPSNCAIRWFGENRLIISPNGLTAKFYIDRNTFATYFCISHGETFNHAVWYGRRENPNVTCPFSSRFYYSRQLQLFIFEDWNNSVFLVASICDLNLKVAKQSIEKTRWNFRYYSLRSSFARGLQRFLLRALWKSVWCIYSSIQKSFDK